MIFGHFNDKELLLGHSSDPKLSVHVAVSDLEIVPRCPSLRFEAE